MQVLNKYDKEQLIIKLHREGKTIREIASIVHKSFSDIKKIISKVDGPANNDLSNKSKPTQALYLFEQSKKPIDIAIELDIAYDEVVSFSKNIEL